MKIKDRYGKEITITDLAGGIKQVRMFKEYKHLNPSPEQIKSDNERQAYWTDLHTKLLQLQSNFKNDKR